MAGIKVPQYPVFKIGTNKLKAANWDIKISIEEALELEEMIKLFEAREFKLIYHILSERDKNIKEISDIKFYNYICPIVLESQGDFKRLTDKKGVRINGRTFKRYLGTTGGLKNNTLLFVNEEVLDELNRRTECGRNPETKLVPAKYEAYKALTCSASQEIISPKKILVVEDCITKYRDDIIKLDNSEATRKRQLKKKKELTEEELEEYEKLKDSPTYEYIENAELENNISDGFSLCTYDYMKRVSEKLGLDYVTDGVCLRNAWFKGMLYAFPIIEFIEKYNGGNYIIKDIWENEQDIRECEMITTSSSFKLAKAYSSIEEYMEKYKENGYEFSVTKISPHKLDDERELNYQYLQSYELTDEDIEEICSPTVKFLRESMGAEYETAKKFIGINESVEKGTWQHALSLDERMIGDPFIIDSIHRLIRKKVDEAKIGKLKVHGNYQIASGDPFAFMQSVCGLKVTGLLQAEECYSQYWNEDKEQPKEVVILRSPMSIHNNIRKCKLGNTEEMKYWYQYMKTIMIINSWDSFCAAENGCDYDSDILFSTNNEVMLKRHRKLPAVHCMQSNAEKEIVTEEAVLKTNKNGMDNKVGVITNKITGFEEVKYRFPEGSQERKDIEYRISCGQLYQQDELDRIKGIIATPMPTYWYNIKACEGLPNEEYLKSICLDKKPYFMIYVYADYKRQYMTYVKNCDKKSQRKFGCTIQELYNKEEKSEEEQEMIKWYEKQLPFGMSPCAMNKICRYVEKSLDGYKSELKKNSEFDYKILRTDRLCHKDKREQMEELCERYVKAIKIFKNKKTKREDNGLLIENAEQEIENRNTLKELYKNKAKEICPNDDERLNIVLDLCYGKNNNKQFCWDTVGDLICKRLEKIHEDR